MIGMAINIASKSIAMLAISRWTSYVLKGAGSFAKVETRVGIACAQRYRTAIPNNVVTITT
jgi:hypothetical protein